MSIEEKQRAQRVSDYADSLVVHRRTDDDARNVVDSSSDREFLQLAELAEALTSIRIEPPSGIDAAVARRIMKLGAQERESRARHLIGRCRERYRAGRRRASRLVGLPITKPITALALNVVVIAVASAVLRSPSASAAEILARTDAALTSLVKPGTVLFRKWRIVDRIRDRPGAQDRVEQRLLLEWIDGSDIRHATGQSVNATGRVYLAYANAMVGGQYSSRIYYEPGFAGEPRGLLSIVPSREDFETALQHFTGPERRLLETYLSRGYIYEPIFSERRFNEAMLKDVSGIGPLQRVQVSLEDSTNVDGQPVYKVRSTDEVRMQFRWRSEGPPQIWLERQETTRYISKKTYLAVRSEETHLDEMGARIETTRELVEVTNLKPTAVGDAFNLHVEDNVPVRRQSAYDHLVEVLRALRRSPTFLSSHSK